MRPDSLHAVACRCQNGAAFNSCIKEFIDEIRFRRAGEVAPTISIPPPTTGNAVNDVFLAGLAEMISMEAGIQPPAWTREAWRFLPEPVFFGGEHSRHHVMQYTPAAMRRRLLFCGELTISKKDINHD